jgi:sigma-B regulation protein RsbU (phosphoserine phosphatase)
VASLERNLSFKQLQINRLLEITQAINNNVKTPDLYRIYKDTLGLVMGVQHLMLVVREDTVWKCATSLGLDPEPSVLDLEPYLSTFTKTQGISLGGHPLLSKFDVVVPVFHKQYPLAYVFIGGVYEEGDRYERIQFVTTITNIITVAIENKRLFKQQLEQERLHRELELAAKVQQMLIPGALPSDRQVELAGVYQPHHGVGGDYYDFIPLDDNRFVFCIADVSGKGIGAALLMSNVQANLHALLTQSLSCEHLVDRLNKSVFRITGGDRFVTLFLAVLDLEARTLSYVNAGHIPPVFSQNGRLQRLDRGCPILGAFERLPFLDTGTLSVAEGGFLVAFTDGLTDLLDETDEFYGEKRLIDFVQGHAGHAASEFNALLVGDLNAFRKERAYTDDISILTCRFFS